MKAEHWKTLDRKIVLNHPRMQLVEDVVELPNGKTAEYLRIAPVKTHSVAIIAINEKQEILLQKEYSYPPDSIMWQLPGGGIKNGEDILEAANRELSEESGMVARSCKIIGSYYVNNRRSDEKQYVALCADLHPKAGQPDDIEFIENYWIPIPKLQDMTAAGEIQNMYLLAALNLWSCVAKGS